VLLVCARDNDVLCEPCSITCLPAASSSKLAGQAAALMTRLAVRSLMTFSCDRYGNHDDEKDDCNGNDDDVA